MQVASELKLGGLLVNMLLQCLYVVNAGCIGVDTCWIASELILVGLLVNVLLQCLYLVNAGCIQVDTCQIDCESAVAVLKSR